jgi:hypothetical protein
MNIYPPEGKAAGVWRWPSTPIYRRGNSRSIPLLPVWAFVVSSGMNFTSYVHLLGNKENSEIMRNQSVSFIYQNYLEPYDKGSLHRFLEQTRIVHRHRAHFSWSSDQGVKLFTSIPLINVQDFMCKHRDNFLFNRWWRFSYIVFDYCKRKYMNHCTPVLLTIKSHEEIMLVISL